MNSKTLLTVGKGIVIILILLAVVFALKAPAADLNALEDSIKAEYVDSSGLPYFSEMDSYYNLRLTQDYVEHGYVGDKMINGSEWDMHRYAPTGNEINYELGIAWLTSWMHDMANQYFGDYSVKEVAFWAGAIISTLAVIPAFIFSRRLTNDYGAIVATLVIVLAPNYFSHTYPGFFDTDMFYYIFPLFFIFFFVEAIRTDNWILKVLYGIISIVSIALFSQSWTGYIFYVALMGLFAVIYLIAMYFFNSGTDKSEFSNPISWLVHQKDFLTIIMLGVIAFAGLAVFQGTDGVLGIFGRVLNLLNLQSASVVVGGFPNVLISVAEMQAPNMLGAGMASMFLANTNGAINGIGGIAILFAGLIVLYILVSRAWKYRSVAAKPADLKPQKGQRLSAAEKLDNDRKFKLSLADLKFGGDNPILADKRLTVLYATLFVVWVLVTILAVTRGSRFITTLVLPFGLLAGIFVGFACDYIKNRMDNDKLVIVAILFCAFLAAVPLASLNTTYGAAMFAVIAALGFITVYALKSNSADKNYVPIKKYVLIIALVIALISPSICGAYFTSQTVAPGTSDPMWNAMQWVNETQSNDTVMTSWWDFGYLFEIAADRQATFDGGSQSGERAFWLGQAMTTDNLELSAGIFRMLDTTGTLADEYLVNITDSPGNATSMIIDILPRTADDAQKVLMNKYHLTSEQAKQTVEYTHPDNPRPVIFVASYDMLGKAGWWTYFGAWNFTNQSSKNYNYFLTTDQVEVQPGTSANMSLYEDSSMIANAVIERGKGNNTTTAHMESVYAHNGSQIMMNGSEYNPFKASNLIVIEDGQLMKNESIANCSDGNYTLFLTGQNNQYTPILMSNELANSMFTQLYLMGGANQNIFENVHVENGVMLYKVNFENTAAGGGSNSTSQN